MGGMCCGQKIEFQGSIFYKKIDYEMEKTGKKELDDVFEKMNDPLEKAEEGRSKIAAAFEKMSVVSGIDVLRKPDVEQALRAFLIKLLVELRKNNVSSDQVLDLEKLNLKELVKISTDPPNVEFDSKTIENLQNMFKVDMNSGELGEMKTSIIKFLESLKLIKGILEEYNKEVTEIKGELLEFKDEMQKNFMNYGVGQSISYAMKAKTNMAKVFYAVDVFNLLAEVGGQVKEALEMMAKIFQNKTEIRKYDELAKIVIEEETKKKAPLQMREVVFLTTNEPKLDSINDAQYNHCYKEVGTLETKK